MIWKTQCGIHKAAGSEKINTASERVGEIDLQWERVLKQEKYSPVALRATQRPAVVAFGNIDKIRTHAGQEQVSSSFQSLTNHTLMQLHRKTN